VKPVLVRVSVLLVVATSLFGCERLRDVKRCRLLAQEVNTSLDTIAEEAADRGRTPVAYGKISREYDALAAGLEDFDGGTPELVKSVHDYATLSRSAARQAAAVGSALAGGNRASAALATHELERLARHEKTLAAHVDEECRPK